MPDDGALRTRRHRLHAAGDHSLCVRCAAKLAEAAPGDAPPVSDAEGELRASAGRLAAACRAQPGNALLARELRMTLQALLPKGAGMVPDDLAELFAELRES